LSTLSEGATILLTWIINLVKWNAGHTKYKFSYPSQSEAENAKVMNRSLVPVRSQEEPEMQMEDNYVATG
jgi:hypothetical protein